MAGYTVSINQQDIYGALAPFIVTVTGLAQNLVVQGLPNRSAMPPASPGFVTMTEARTKRLRYNVDTWDITTFNPTVLAIEQGIELITQIDVYGPTAQDMAVALTTLLRDEVGVQALAPVCAPLYCDDAVLAPLDDSEMQYEQRWVFELHMQYNPVVTPPQQFASEVTVEVRNVDQEFPPHQ